MRDIITYEEFILEQKGSEGEDREDETEEEQTEEELDAAEGVDRYFFKWIRKRKDRALNTQDAMRPRGQVSGQYGDSMQFGSKI
jgi:hypothetical protein